MNIVVVVITARVLCSATALAEEKTTKNTTKIEGRCFPFSAITGIGSCPPCRHVYGSTGVRGVVTSLGITAGREHGTIAASLPGAAIHSGAGIAGAPVHGHGLRSGANVGHGTPGAASEASISANVGAVAPGAIGGQGLSRTGGTGVLGIPLVTTPGISANGGGDQDTAATRHSGFRTVSGFTTATGGHKAGQGSFAYDLGGSDSSSYGHSSSNGDSKSFGVSASEGSKRAQGQGSHGITFDKQAAGSEASSHSSGMKTKVVS